MIGRGEYCGDEMMAEYLRGIGAQCSLHGIYGLFHGCLAAPRMGMPSTYMPLEPHRRMGPGEGTGKDACR